MADPFDLDDDVLARPRPHGGWRERVEHLADATGSSPGRILTGAAVTVAVVGLGLWLTRAPAMPPEANLPFVTTVAGPLASVSTSTTEPTELIVHVAGAVAQPGVHHVAAGARVFDAIDAAGGLAPQADGARINLAAPVADGERVYVPAVGEAAPPAVAGPAVGGASAPSGPLNLNTATADQLDGLPGVGPATAAAIIDHREQIGGFTSVDQLLDVRGIGEAKLDQLRDLVTV